MLRFQVLECVPKPARKIDPSGISAFTQYPDRTAPYHVSRVWLFGRTEGPEHESVAVRIVGFKPHFYIKTPSGWGPGQRQMLMAAILSKLGAQDKLDMHEPEIVEALDFYGFRNFEKDTFIKLSFRTENARSACKYVFSDLKSRFGTGLESYESSVSADMQLQSSMNLVSWIEIPFACMKPVSNATKCKHTFEAHHLDVVSLPDMDAVAPMKIMSIDIETSSTDLKQSDSEKDCVFQIAASVRTAFSTDDQVKRFLFALAPCDVGSEPVDFKLIVCATEEELLLEFAQLVSELDPDVFTGWNTDGFDFKYLFVRARRQCCLREFSKRLARITSLESFPSVQTEQFKTRAFGASIFHRLHCPGRINLDLLFYFRRTTKMDSYKLDNVAKTVLGKDEGKLDMSYVRMWEAFNARDARAMGDVARYCVVDADLVLRIASANQVWLRLLEQSRVTFVPISQLGTRGEQIKTFSQLLRFGHDLDYLMPDHTHQKANGLIADVEDEEDSLFIDDDVSYSGGYVLEPLVDAYFDEPVHVFDFQSLYPSIIRAHRLCFTSWIFDEKKYGNIPGFEYKVVEIEENRKYYFCMHERTVLPKLQDLLFAKRKAVKALLKDEKDPFIREVLDARQLGLKLAMNASYGFLAANRLKCKPIGESITAIGRSMIQETQAYIEETVNGSTVIYGDTDSVFFTVKDTSLGSFDCEGLARKITETLFRRPIVLEYEKSFNPLILQAKKRYLGIKFDAGKMHLPGKRDSKGDVLQRRDVPLAVKELYDKMCDLVLEKRRIGVSESLALLRTELDAIVRGETDPMRLSVTRQLSKPVTEYAATNSHLPHVEVAKKKIARGEQVESNDRIRMLIVADRAGKATPEWSRAECIDFFIQNKLAYDINYYIGTYETPIKNLLASIAPPNAVDFVFRKAYASAKRVSQNNQDIRGFFAKRTSEEEGGPMLKK